MQTSSKLSTSDLIVHLSNVAGTDKNGESRASNAYASMCASLSATLQADADPTVSAALDAKALNTARRAMRIRKETAAERSEAALQERISAARALVALPPEDIAVLRGARNVLTPPKAPKSPETQATTTTPSNGKAKRAAARAARLAKVAQSTDPSKVAVPADTMPDAPVSAALQ